MRYVIAASADLELLATKWGLPKLGSAPHGGHHPQELDLVSAVDVYNSEYEEPAAIIERLLFKGLTIVGGRPKVGKSWLAMQIALAVATNTEFAGALETGAAGRVLYLALEEPLRRTAPRLRKLIGQVEALSNVNFVYSIPPLMAGGAEQLDASLSSSPVALVVIDTYLAFSRQANRPNMDVVQWEYNMVTRIREIAEKHGCAILLIHHTRKALGPGLDIVLGTSAVTAAADAVWTLRQVSGGESILRVMGRDMEETEYRMRLEPGEPFGWRITGAGAEAVISPERREIVALLIREGPQAPKAIASKLGKNGATVRRLLQGLLGDGVVTKIGANYTATGDRQSDEQHERPEERER